MKYEYKNRIKRIKAILSDTDGVLLRRQEFFYADIDSGKKRNLHLDDANMIRRISGTDLNIGFRCSHELPFCKEKLYSYGISDIFTLSNNVNESIQQFLNHYNLHISEIGYLTASPSNVLHYLPRLLTFVPGDVPSREKKLAVHATQKVGGQGCLAEVIRLVLDAKNAPNKGFEKRDLTGYHPFYY